MRALALALLLIPAVLPEDPPAHPLMGEFMGINGHTIQFKPELYSKVCRKARDYHPIEWDLGKDSDFKTTFPEARNRVNWNDVYGSWKKEGFETDLCVMLNGIPARIEASMATEAEPSPMWLCRCPTPLVRSRSARYAASSR